MKKLISAVFCLVVLLFGGVGTKIYAAAPHSPAKGVYLTDPRASKVFDGADLYLDDSLYSGVVYLTGYGDGSIRVTLQKKSLFGWSNILYVSDDFTNEVIFSCSGLHSEKGTLRCQVKVSATVNGNYDERTYTSREFTVS